MSATRTENIRGSIHRFCFSRSSRKRRRYLIMAHLPGLLDPSYRARLRGRTTGVAGWPTEYWMSTLTGRPHVTNTRVHNVARSFLPQTGSASARLLRVRSAPPGFEVQDESIARTRAFPHPSHNERGPRSPAPAWCCATGDRSARRRRQVFLRDVRSGGVTYRSHNPESERWSRPPRRLQCLAHTPGTVLPVDRCDSSSLPSVSNYAGLGLPHQRKHAPHRRVVAGREC